jgi:hypothetical protein
MTAAFLETVGAAARRGLSVAQIASQYGYDNRAIRRAKAELYRTGALPSPAGYEPKAEHAIHIR